MPTLYLIRHGIAAERGTYPNDGDRPLTDEGQRKTRQVAKRLQELELRFDLILSSPLLRARQTAEILQDVGLGDRLELTADLAPDGDFDHWLHWLLDQPDRQNLTLALVGHQPDLGNWTERLVWGEVGDRLVLKKAGVVGLTLPNSGSPVGQSDLFWLTPPRYLL
ncbi:MAG: phosphohistidine phosphatase SixA [Synechococcales bacterium]|nr:phosphohistidine phosphatase SixA [Synechococcales bacterium]